ncbi:esterase-like activity of phytase family protein [Kocuria massiliensis]|uniref:esterase-like activity of phytase family protein n=1 Tax=Kocuria massiliensis TaxID=1926282 RepID=UPI0022B941EC|nr:esterase-like activity of phytase family protein [Kocuria massiliensis]
MTRKRNLLLATAAAGILMVPAVPASAHPPQKAPGTEVYSTDIKDLGSVGGVDVKGSAYGSSLTPKPGDPNVFYGLTDRGPNVDGPGGVKLEPYPNYAPQIGEFRMVNGKAKLNRVVELRGTDGKPFNGQVSPEADTGEEIQDLNGTVLPKSDHGYDSEGLVAMPDGSFWVSDEYGPYVTHFDAHGREIKRLSPFDGSLPGELSMRDPNKGMEGLTVTPDGKTLVGAMQSALVTPDLKGKPKNVVPTRIVTVDIATGKSHEYLYMRHLDSAATNISEITALSDHEFLVDERDGDMGANSYKKLQKIDTSKATDVSRNGHVPNSTYDAAKGGLLVGGKSIEGMTGKSGEMDAAKALQDAGITPAPSQMYLDVTKLAWGIDPTGGYFAHDKIEGVAALNGGRDLWISNDSDYGLAGSTGDKPPYGLDPKLLPNGDQDDGEFLHVNMDSIPVDAQGPGYTPAASGGSHHGHDNGHGHGHDGGHGHDHGHGNGHH